MVLNEWAQKAPTFRTVVADYTQLRQDTRTACNYSTCSDKLVKMKMTKTSEVLNERKVVYSDMDSIGDSVVTREPSQCDFTSSLVVLEQKADFTSSKISKTCCGASGKKYARTCSADARCW